jgi:hypothetical protein
LGGSDSASFSNAGLPGIGTPQDPIAYEMTSHTNLDRLDRIVPKDVEKAALIIAGEVWHLADRKAMAPRSTKDTMPLPVSLRVF